MMGLLYAAIVENAYGGKSQPMDTSLRGHTIPSDGMKEIAMQSVPPATQRILI